MLTQQPDLHVAGINGVEWDAVELPSQFMENWCYDKPTLLALAKHYQTGEVLPDEMFSKLVAARTYRWVCNCCALERAPTLCPQCS